MAEPLVNQFGPAVPRKIGAMLSDVGKFDASAFVATALDGYHSLNLMQRAVKIADALQVHLPANYEKSIKLLLASLDTSMSGPLQNTGGNGMTPFLYLPHTLYVARHGLEHFELSMQAQYVLTQRFTAEFSIRPFIERYPQQCLALLKTWARDDNEHVRRLVSEGTRPRLPWAARLRSFQKDPAPVISLLELLKDDSALYVRRSVANNLNDIGKDHPDVLVSTARRWMKDANENRLWIIKHALRSAVKRAEPEALSVLGFGDAAKVVIAEVSITPQRAQIGGRINIGFALTNPTRRAQEVLVDFRIHYIKANGLAKPKVFKLKQLTLSPGETANFSKRVSLQEMTTRKHYPGTHRVDAVINGVVHTLGEFELKKPR
jgi:3-methyladenine DNA glycosylase AlkC